MIITIKGDEMNLDRWQILGYLFAFISPVLGLMMGIALTTDKKSKEYQSTGRSVLILSVLMIVAWGLFLFRKGVF